MVIRDIPSNKRFLVLQGIIDKLPSVLLCGYSSVALCVIESNTHSTGKSKYLVDGFFNTEMHRGVHTEIHGDNANINGGCSFYVSYIVLPLNWYLNPWQKRKRTITADLQLQITPEKNFTQNRVLLLGFNKK